MSVRVLIADDQDLVRVGLQTILDAQPDIEVVGAAANGAEAIAAARRLRPDVCLLDIRMPGTDGLTATEAIARGADPTPVVVITTFDLDEYVYRALRAGAHGFLLKNCGPALLREAVHAAARGDALIDPKVTLRLIDAFARSDPSPAAPPSAPLTEREQHVLTEVARGLSNAQIGGELHISLSTVKTHIAGIMAKTGSRNRVELAMWAAASRRGPAGWSR